MSTKPPNPLTLALANVQEPFRSRIIEKYISLREAFVGGAFDATGLRGGVFAEVTLRMLQQVLTGTHIAFGTPIGSFEDECLKLQRLPKTAGHESLRIVVPRALSFLYTIRNKRGIGHAGGDVEANKIDAATCVRVADWICCELIRLYHGASLEEAQGVVDALSVRELPSVWMIGGKTRVLDTSLDYKSQALLLLYAHAEQVVLVEDLREWIEYPEVSRFSQRILEPLHRDRLVEWDRDNGAVTLSPKGAKHVEDRIVGTSGPK
jgi:hypothetical protein